MPKSEVQVVVVVSAQEVLHSSVVRRVSIARSAPAEQVIAMPGGMIQKAIS